MPIEGIPDCLVLTAETASSDGRNANENLGWMQRMCRMGNLCRSSQIVAEVVRLLFPSQNRFPDHRPEPQAHPQNHAKLRNSPLLSCSHWPSDDQQRLLDTKIQARILPLST